MCGFVVAVVLGDFVRGFLLGFVYMIFFKEMAADREELFCYFCLRSVSKKKIHEEQNQVKTITYSHKVFSSSERCCSGTNELLLL